MIRPNITINDEAIECLETRLDELAEFIEINAHGVELYNKHHDNWGDKELNKTTHKALVKNNERLQELERIKSVIEFFSGTADRILFYEDTAIARDEIEDKTEKRDRQYQRDIYYMLTMQRAAKRLRILLDTCVAKMKGTL